MLVLLILLIWLWRYGLFKTAPYFFLAEEGGEGFWGVEEGRGGERGGKKLKQSLKDIWDKDKNLNNTKIKIKIKMENKKKNKKKNKE